MSERLQRLRHDREWSQPELAERAGVSVGTLRQWELGTRTPTFDEAIVALADALEVSLEELAGRTPPREAIIRLAQAAGLSLEDLTGHLPSRRPRGRRG